jgi:hypothetical protein
MRCTKKRDAGKGFAGAKNRGLRNQILDKALRDIMIFVDNEPEFIDDFGGELKIFLVQFFRWSVWISYPFLRAVVIQVPGIAQTACLNNKKQM